MTTQDAVDGIRGEWTKEERILITFRSPKGRQVVKEFSWPDLEDGAARVWKRRGFAPISREIVSRKVGTTPENEEHIGGYSE